MTADELLYEIMISIPGNYYFIKNRLPKTEKIFMKYMDEFKKDYVGGKEPNEYNTEDWQAFADFLDDFE